ncbi:MAG: DNA mismatch endonuclease Vsr [Phycisphaerales bacterium]|nr:DNA mismatch endonuclease Vsr [Phycisphaerales bacterium]
MDRLTREHRSWNMSRIRGRNTRPEREVRSMLHRLGFRFRLHSRQLPGRPDVVLPKYGSVVLVHGCFWHRHPGCPFAYTPKSRAAFWSRKFAGNVARDRRNTEALEREGWRVLIVWECELRSPRRLSARLRKALVSRGRAMKGRR